MRFWPSSSTIEPSTAQEQRRSRRSALLVGATGGIAALLGSESSARAANGDPLILGSAANVAGARTDVHDGGTTYHVQLNGTSTLGPSDAGPGEYLALGAWTENGGSTVVGENDSGYGVRGLGGAAGVFADGGLGTGLRVTGRAQFQLSGKAVVAGTSATPQSSVRVQMPKGIATGLTIPLAPTSLILATVQKHVPGVSVQSAVPDAGNTSFTVYLSKAVTTTVPIAWFIVDD